MTTNAYLFMWSEYGIESIVPITQYEDQMKLDTWTILKGEKPGKNPIDDIIGAMTMRAQANGQRRYEIYAMDCAEGITEEDLLDLWDTNPQYAADLTREKGVSLFGSKSKPQEIKIR